MPYIMQIVLHSGWLGSVRSGPELVWNFVREVGFSLVYEPPRAGSWTSLKLVQHDSMRSVRLDPGQVGPGQLHRNHG
jgi:hypothetical protein